MGMLASNEWEGHPLADLLADLAGLLGREEFTKFERALQQVVGRALEMAVLSDERLSAVTDAPDRYRGRAGAELIADRLGELGIAHALDGADVLHIRRLLLAGGDEEAPPPILRQIERETLAGRDHQGVDLRCLNCGYHFRADDVRGRLEHVEFAGWVLAADLEPNRKLDSFKGTVGTELHLDHIVPRLGWGPTASPNMQVLCSYCNLGKAIHRWGLESVGAQVASSLPRGGEKPSAGIRRAALVGRLMDGPRLCERCGASPDTAELTGVWDGGRLASWTLRIECYGCWDPPD